VAQDRESVMSQEVLAENHRPRHGPASPHNNFLRHATRLLVFKRWKVGIRNMLRAEFLIGPTSRILNRDKRRLLSGKSTSGNVSIA
jgi:hypothetical protein